MDKPNPQKFLSYFRDAVPVDDINRILRARSKEGTTPETAIAEYAAPERMRGTRQKIRTTAHSLLIKYHGECRSEDGAKFLWMTLHLFEALPYSEASGEAEEFCRTALELESNISDMPGSDLYGQTLHALVLNQHYLPGYDWQEFWTGRISKQPVISWHGLRRCDPRALDKIPDVYKSARSLGVPTEFLTAHLYEKYPQIATDHDTAAQIESDLVKLHHSGENIDKFLCVKNRRL